MNCLSENALRWPTSEFEYTILLNLKILKWACFFNFTGVVKCDFQVRADAYICLLGKDTVLSGKWSPTFLVNLTPEIFSLIQNGYFVSTVGKVAEA
jgi:hypothetical protein